MESKQNVQASNSPDSSMKWFFGGSCVIAVALYVTSFILNAKYLGSTDDWIKIKNHVWTTVGLSIGGSLMLMLAAFLYMFKDPQKVTYYLIIITTLSFGLSYASLAISAISKA